MKMLWQRQLNPPRQGGSSDPYWDYYDISFINAFDKTLLSDVVDAIEIPIRQRVHEDIAEAVGDAVMNLIYS